MSVKVTLVCQLKSAEIQALNHFLAENLPRVRQFQGCQRVSIFFNLDKTQMLIDEDWQSQQHHQQYLEFIQQNGVLNQLAAFFQAPPEIQYYQLCEL